jgi:acyl-CoA hydrolase
MHQIDGGALAAPASRNYVVTASMDHLDFGAGARGRPAHPALLGEPRLHTSVEVGVVLGGKLHRRLKRHVSSAYLTFVAVDQAANTASAARHPRRKRKRRYEDAGRQGIGSGDRGAAER